MSNRKLFTFAVAAVLLLMPLVAFASTTRIEGMALQGDYTSDYTAIYGWPSTITGVGSLAYGELGNNFGNLNYERAMGVVLPGLWDGKYGVWALHLRESTPNLGSGDNYSSASPGVAGFDPNANANQAFDLNWGKKFGGSKSLGLQLNRSLNKGTLEIPGETVTYAFSPVPTSTDAPSPYTGEFGRNLLGFGGGLSFDLNAKTTADVSVLFQNRTFESSDAGSAVTTDKFVDNGGSNYLIGVRAMMKCKPNVTMVPVVKLYNYDLSWKATQGTTSTTYSNQMSGWQVGVAGNWTLGSNDLFVMGLTFAQNKLDQNSGNKALLTGVPGFGTISDDLYGIVSNFNSNSPAAFHLDPTKEVVATETIMPQLFMALETQVNSWLTLRMGANKGAFTTYKVEGKLASTGKSETVKYSSSPFTMNTGAGVKVGSLTFDALLDGTFFLNPLAQLQGNAKANYAYGTGGNVFEKVSATYHW